MLTAAGVPNAPINTIEAALAEPHVAASGILQMFETDHGPLNLIGCPITLDGQRPLIRRLPPALGEHNELVLGTATTTLHSTTGQSRDQPDSDASRFDSTTRAVRQAGTI